MGFFQGMKLVFRELSPNIINLRSFYCWRQMFKKLISAQKFNSSAKSLLLPFSFHSLSFEARQVFTPRRNRKTSAAQLMRLPQLPRRSKQRIFVFQLQFSLGAKTFELCRYRRRKKKLQLLHIFAIFMHLQQSYAKCLFLSHSSLLKLFKLATHRCIYQLG